MSLEPFLANRATASGTASSGANSAQSGSFQRLFADAAHSESPGSRQTRLDAPKVDVIEENGRVAGIVVTCRCCERIELTCRY